MRNQESEIDFLGATAGLPSSALYHLFERALVSIVTPAKAGVQSRGTRDYDEELDSGFRRNDEDEKASLCLKLTPMG